jgi:peptide deformylase
LPVLPLRIYGDPVLRARAKAVVGLTDKFRPFVLDLFDTMLAEDGVGLAAPQVGVSEQVLVLAVPIKKHQRVDLTLVNPEIVASSGWEVGEEGCLSVPGVYDEIKRAYAIELKALDETGRPIELKAEGYLARAIQHEIDHLKGVLFVDKFGMLQKQLHKKELKALEQGRIPVRGSAHAGPAL